MVISARSNWFIDPLNPVSCERSCKPELRPVSSCFRSVYDSSTSPPQHQKDKCLQKHDKAMWCEIRPSFSLVCGDGSLLGYYGLWIGKYRHFGGVCLHLQGSSSNWPEDRSNRLLRNAGWFTSWHGFIPEDASSRKWEWLLTNGVIYFYEIWTDLTRFAGDLIFHSCCWGFMPFGILRRVDWYPRLFGRTVVP